MSPPLSILLVEDDTVMRSMMGQVLRTAGYGAIECEDALAAAEVLKRERVDLVVTDVVMPKKDGIEFIQEVRGQWPRLPIIAISGGGNHLDDVYCLKVARSLGAAATLPKPFDGSKLLEIIAEVLARQAPPAA